MIDEITPRVTVHQVNTKESARGEDVEPVTPEEGKSITDKVKGALDQTESEKVSYDLTINALTEQGARATARAYVRAQHPFTPSTLDIIMSEDVGDNKYRISVGAER